MKYVYLIAYVLSILLANFLLDCFIKLPLFGLLSAGTIFFAFVFTLRDHLHQYGLKFVFFAIFCAILVNSAFAYVYEIPLRFMVASFFSILCSELTDTTVFEKLKNYAWHKKVLSSNAISVPIDSSLFTLIAFLGVYPEITLIQLILTDVVAKYLLATLLISKTILPKTLFMKRQEAS